jgi:CubicO group peptidase (beta-lactamase class C family)
MKPSRLGAIIFLMVTVSVPGVAQTTGDRYREKLQPVIEKLMERQQIPGFAAAVVEGNRIAWATGLGVKDLRRKDDPVTTRTLFHMASNTKPFCRHVHHAACRKWQNRPRRAGS